MSVALFHGVPSLVDESGDEEAMEPNARAYMKFMTLPLTHGGLYMMKLKTGPF
ncbi:BnaC05g32980D [Brassica napus]|uniref:(rape) hypothetical protein n=1 Tax=Brassica napus TaxID=3708 RepID=A0A078GH54_BRANA|nr:unnamed protein product [Brassica napus]CDY24614.1 BnaC05g32980D [Brassica napus]